MFFFFFFKQKTAYEMRISDWSSDVCSSDLTGGLKAKRAGPRTGRMKPNARFPDAKVKAYWSSLERRCVVCKSTQDTVLHHILARLPQKLRQRDHRFVAILCAAHHNMGDDSVHLLGSEAAFQHR